MRIRKTTIEDLPQVMDIYRQARVFMAEHGNPLQWGPTKWPPLALIRQDIAAGESYVCVGDEDEVRWVSFSIDMAKISIRPMRRSLTASGWMRVPMGSCTGSLLASIIKASLLSV